MGLTHFNALDAGDLDIPWVSLERQVRIATRIDDFEAASKELASRLSRQVDLLVEHRQALITAAVTGEMAVPGVAA